ncbi:MAG: ADP-glyceromanno-heptose 6-epimerase [Gammaproteobacteria bacterium CG_4_10_14_0_8_um_filter_38_16]|nr:MAG: ADP-glyceromanno-heptose 6-epimerase [Gammaproteobacteria bacterium CG_4_10_14_0_8_um_filter_38_16]PJA04322.1 MAG: ADP-glyceromanno-heptose 6-epimerase [Gammaproteobacteria bacterium CG_4_10_14_0_2_um_filter_38_22]PJB10076.1 MAG: ADP-glyceromanno-heptose 6-epimerase [Gammaproteobacteria bacterium CG_4_9_14_3_um_filter_38_9]
MIVVTGAAGFIGSNIIRGLNKLGITDILAVDDLTDGKKYRNLAVVHYRDYLDYQDFLALILSGHEFETDITAFFHQGACSDTMEWNGQYMMKNNYDYSKALLHYCLDRKIQFIYASSAAVYGAKNNFDDRDPNQLPLNVYGYSKWQFDEYVQPYLKDAQSQIVGLRYFNVYGPHENHKGKMASVAFHLMNQLENTDTVKLFAAYGGYADGAHERDFILVDDVVRVNLWFYQNAVKKGIFNCGTGQARCFNDIAKKLLQLNGSGKLDYIPFPDSLKGAYQCFTQANLTALRAIGFQASFTALEDGLEKYFHWFHGDGKFHRA